ncbi:hypothetical protein M3J09_011596 [Ascochyta lentis]
MSAVEGSLDQKLPVRMFLFLWLTGAVVSATAVVGPLDDRTLVRKAPVKVAVSEALDVECWTATGAVGQSVRSGLKDLSAIYQVRLSPGLFFCDEAAIFSKTNGKKVAFSLLPAFLVGPNPI